jgi:hypothetical protein
VLNVVLSWFLIALIPVAAVALRFLAEDAPRNQEEPEPEPEPERNKTEIGLAA